MSGPRLFDRVKESSTTTGTGTLTLAGAVTGFRSFTSVLSNADTTLYAAYGVDASGNPSGEWETGLGTFTTSGTTLARTTVLASSNAGAAVNLSAGTKHVAITTPADFANRWLNPTNTYANLAAFQAGRILLPSDAPWLLRDTGSALAPWGPLWPLTLPVLGDYTANNSASANATNGGIYLADTAQAGAYQVRSYTKSAPATPWTFTALLTGQYDAAGFFNFGLCFKAGSTLVLFGPWLSASGSTTWTVDNMTTATAQSSRPFNTTANNIPAGVPVWMRLADNGTNRLCQLSAAGWNWLTVYSVSRTTFLTATDVGFFVNTYSAAGGMFLHSLATG